MAYLTDEQRLVLNNWARTEPALRTAFDYTSGQGVPGTAPPSDGLGDRLIAPEPGSAEELATLQKEVDFTASDTIVYQGFSQPGVETSEAAWRITRTVFTTNVPNSDDVTVEFADNDTDFVHIWDNRVGLSYGV